MTIKHSYKEVERQRRELDILTAAEKMLTDGGYASLNMDELANLIGISKPTLYQHFKSKEELAVRVLLHSFSFVQEFMARPLDEPAIERLFELLNLFSTMHAPGSVHAVLRPNLEPQLIRAAMLSSPEYVEERQRFIDYLHLLIDTAKQEGAIAADIPTPFVGQMLLALSRSFARPPLDGKKDAAADSPEQIEANIRILRHVFLHGVAPVPEQHPI